MVAGMARADHGDARGSVGNYERLDRLFGPHRPVRRVALLQVCAEKAAISVAAVSRTLSEQHLIARPYRALLCCASRTMTRTLTATPDPKRGSCCSPAPFVLSAFRFRNDGVRAARPSKGACFTMFVGHIGGRGVAP